MPAFWCPLTCCTPGPCLHLCLAAPFVCLCIQVFSLSLSLSILYVHVCTCMSGVLKCILDVFLHPFNLPFGDRISLGPRSSPIQLDRRGGKPRGSTTCLLSPRAGIGANCHAWLSLCSKLFADQTIPSAPVSSLYIDSSHCGLGLLNDLL